MEVDPFPASDFDAWASNYDQSVLNESRFPFFGYQKALETVVSLAALQLGMRVLDLGVGTGNLAARFVALGCRLWGTDFSPAMLAEARRKLPQAEYMLADLRQGWPAGLPPVFDRIVSAYVFHHFEMSEKARLCLELAGHLAPQGRLVIADIAFPDQASLEKTRQMVREDWEDEFYWLADETIATFRQAGLETSFMPVSDCAGVFVMEKS